jgi:putative ubiquitin-RnfH superfamily antitoxin RatB of RatAB toxin-antitoxin module
MADSDAPIEVEVVYAQAQHAVVKRVALPAGSRVGDALLLAAADAAFDCVDLSHATLGIYGVMVGRDQILTDGDRIEIYRPLAQDPKSARRNRARAGRRR